MTRQGARFRIDDQIIFRCGGRSGIDSTICTCSNSFQHMPRILVPVAMLWLQVDFIPSVESTVQTSSGQVQIHFDIELWPRP
jgi:hypothetical protein